MVNNWEIEWNSSMLEHGRDLGTMEFIFAKGGTVADMNYVMFDVQDTTWEPLIKAVAERDNSHPDIIRKNVQEQGALGVPQGFTPGVAVNPQMVVAANRRAVQQANQALDAQQRGQAVREGSTNVGDLYGAGFKGRAAMQAGKNIMGAAKDMGGRALQAVKDSGIGQRMGNFMGKVGRGISDLRHAPAAAKQAFRDSRARREDEARRNTLETGLGRGSKMEAETERRMVPGSQNFDANMDRAKGAINQQLARDYNINVPTKDGNPTMTAQDAMRQEIKDIGARREQPKEGFFAGMKRRGEEQRARNQAQKEGAAYAPSNVVPEEEEPEPPAMPEAPNEAAARVADTDIVPEEKEKTKFTFAPEDGPERGTPPDTGVVDPQPVAPETATATETGDGMTAEQFADQMVDTAGYKGGDSRRKARDVALGLFDKPEGGYDAITQATGSRGYRAKLAQAVADYHGLSPAQADATVQAAEQGNPDAKEKVEEATGQEKTKFTFDNPDMASEMAEIENFGLSEDNHEASWDSLLKGLDIR